MSKEFHRTWHSRNHQHHQYFCGFWCRTIRLENCYCQIPAKKNKNNSLDKNVLKNYQPISNLPFLSKILKKVVLHQLIAHLQENNLYNPFQSAYWPDTAPRPPPMSCWWSAKHYGWQQHFCPTLTGSFGCFWYCWSPNSSFLSRNCLGIHSTALQWFWSYLLDRNQSTFVNSSTSSPLLLFGVPQGSVLGSVLIVLYTTPLSDVMASHSVNHQFLADDTQLHKSAPPNNIQSLTHDLQFCTYDIKSQMCNNQLKLKYKTKVILFWTPSLPSDCLPSSVTVGTHQIAFSDKVRNLGFIHDPNLTMKQHIIKVCGPLTMN